MYRIHVGFIHEDDGVSVLVLNLPGTGSCGANEIEARANVADAVRGIIESHQDDGKEIPWLCPSQYEIPDDTTARWYVVVA